ncbi:plastocyanin/azurin family copper-binding protein [Pendulispora albinea]|uniref:Plastocyanin/azurin family copper-binding protein n=1 Tax=Pendulispora albinea TaxID=2741071 RepID=A0ABZ2LKY7_9BACT
MKPLFRAASIAGIAFALTATACGKGTHEQNIASVGDTMAFDVTGFSVKTGTQVHLVLKNNGTTPAMTHNWVLVKPGTEAAVATAGMNAGQGAGYVQAGDGNIIAHTPLSAPGSTVEITFTAPAPGMYPYICTYPGHYQTMKGTMQVTP